MIRMKKNVFAKTNEQSQAGLDYAMARKRRMKSNVSIMSYKLPMTCKAMIMTVLYVDFISIGTEHTWIGSLLYPEIHKEMRSKGENACGILGMGLI